MKIWNSLIFWECRFLTETFGRTISLSSTIFRYLVRNIHFVSNNFIKSSYSLRAKHITKCSINKNGQLDWFEWWWTELYELGCWSSGTKRFFNSACTSVCLDRLCLIIYFSSHQWKYFRHRERWFQPRAGYYYCKFMRQ